MNPLLEQFLLEARENLSSIEEHLQNIKSGDAESLNSVFRAVHTLKGGAGIVKFDAIKVIAHKAEDFLDTLRTQKLECSEGMLEALYDAFDEVQNLVEASEQSGDVVRGDIETIDRLITALEREFGAQKVPTPTFKLPFCIPEDKEHILLRNFLHLNRLRTIPLEDEILDEANINDKRPYVIYFDVTHGCMEYGNDPIYVLSLLKEGLVSVVMQLDEEEARELTNEREAEILGQLYGQIFAVVYASYPEIESALYNFLDDLQIVPLSMQTLLNTYDKRFTTIDFFKDLQKSALVAIEKKEKEKLRDLLASAYSLVPKNSLESLFLQRVEGLLDVLAQSDFRGLDRFFAALAKGEAYRYDPAAVSEIPPLVESKEDMQKILAPQTTKQETLGKVIKVEQESVDTLMMLVGELLVAKNSLPYLANQVEVMDSESVRRSILEKYSFINRLTNRLQDTIMSMRMLPIAYVFSRYPKLVREMSKELNKKVHLIQEGEETRLDKNMIEMLADPLVHIVRNSLDHGIENVDERMARGKNQSGEIVMKAYSESNRVVIEVRDDGKGIDTQKLVQKALERGLIDKEAVAMMSESEKAMLITLPGLSTAESVSEYSGRGVGMDVVRRKIEEFGGSMEIRSEGGKGTTIKLSVPATLALANLLHVIIKGNHYGFLMEYVSETVKIEKKEIVYFHNEPFISLRERLIPLFWMRELQEIDTKGESECLSVVILQVKENPLAVIVDALCEQLDVVQKPLSGILATHPIISGTALLGNGEIIMTLDPLGIFRLFEERRGKKEGA